MPVGVVWQNRARAVDAGRCLKPEQLTVTGLKPGVWHAGMARRDHFAGIGAGIGADIGMQDRHPGSGSTGSAHMKF
jgi:hypothetical protein